MKVLVTGATGFVGGHVTEVLVASGYEVTALVRRGEQRSRVEALGATAVLCDLEDADAVDRTMADVDIVYHIAGATAARTEAEYTAANVDMTRRLVAACERASSPPHRFVYVSSQAAVGPSPRGTPLAEEAPCAPVTRYGRSKLAAEGVVRAARVPWTIVRPSAVYGERDREFLLLFRTVRGGVAPVFGRGDQEMQLIYVRDLADLIALVGAHEGCAGRIYHAAHPEPATSEGVVRAVARALECRVRIIHLPRVVAAGLVRGFALGARLSGARTVVQPDKLPEFFAPSWLLDVSRAARDLGWRARFDLDAGLAPTIAWYRSTGWL